MRTKNFIIREIAPEDNFETAKVIRAVLTELNIPKIGTAYEDKATDLMFESYQKENAFYYVITYKDAIVGGAGIAHLSGYDTTVCELQKMYFMPIARGKGLGAELISMCLQKAKSVGYKRCYLETMPSMEAARTLYKKNGFVNLEEPMGDTGHFSCNVWMIKEL